MSAHTEPGITQPQLIVLKSLVDKQRGAPDISRYDEWFLIKTLQKRFQNFRCGDTADYLKILRQNTDEVSLFLKSLLIGYSDFFRNALTFSVLEQIVLPLLVQKKRDSKRKEIRIWSSACAGGQEPYSIAMLMEELKNGDSDKFSYRIFATDQNEVLINSARQGNYAESALKNLNLKRLNNWFTKKDDTYTVKRELSNNIDFSVFDLLSGQFMCPPASIFGDFDIIIISNLLFYYRDRYRQAILEKTGNCLATGGYLVTGETERQILLHHKYTEAFPQSAIFRKK